ncbi:inner centromere protein B isoform X2 [Anabrus simplex]|uniref:inner centromere protein B isoform X2 n=1 Tax=Anabrus simplex TaxID=316456 RepID=UPI0035A3334A
MEKLEWLRQVVEDAKANGFQRPNLPKTPAAAKRTRKRCRLSTIAENEVVEVPLPEQTQTRMTRNAAKMAKHKLWTLEASPDHRPSKKCKPSKNDLPVRLFDESVIICTPDKDIVKKEVIAVDDRGDQQHQNSNPSVVSRSLSNSEPSLSTDSGFDAKMILEEDPPPTQCLNTTFVVKMLNDPLAPSTDLVPPANMSESPPLKQSSAKEVQFSQHPNRTYECFTPLKQEVVDSSDKVQHNESLIDLITPYKQKMNCTFDICANKQSIKPEEPVKSVQKPNLTCDRGVLKQSIEEHATTPLQTLHNDHEDGILGEKYVETQTTVHQQSIDKTEGTENSSLKGKYDETQVVICETDVDIVSNVIEFDGFSFAGKCNEIQNVVDLVREAETTAGSPSSASSTNCAEGRAPQTLCSKDQSKELNSVDLKKMHDQETPASTCRTVTQQESQTPKGKRIPTVFSPYINESVKKRVAAYEKLQSVAEIPVPEKLEETRMTRTKTRAAAAAAAAVVAECEPAEEKAGKQKKQKKNDIETMRKLAKIPLVTDKNKYRCDEPGKENSIAMSSSRNIMQSGQKSNSRTPYTTSHVLGDIHNLSSLSAKSNSTISSKPGIIHTSVDTFINKLHVKPTIEEKEEKKLEERKKREEKELEAVLKKEELLREKIEAQKRKREERMRKVLITRQAQEKEKEEQQRLLLEEKNQRMKLIIREQEAKQKEQVGKKKLHTQQKMAEVEERRKLEETMRLAKLKEQEEEQERIQALRKREQEEAEKLRQKRLAEEKEAALLREKAEQQAKAEVKTKEIQSKVNEMTESKVKLIKAHPINSKIGPIKDGVAGLIPKNTDDYGIDDINSDDTSDDEEKPKKIIPKWAQKSHLSLLKQQLHVPEEILSSFMSSVSHTPDLSKIFPSLLRLKRTSSAVWATPPLHSSKNAGSRVVS